MYAFHAHLPQWLFLTLVQCSSLILLPRSVGNTGKIDKCSDKIFDKNEIKKKLVVIC